MEHPLRGAELDAALERRIELEDVEHQLGDMYVLLDTLADSRDLPVSVVKDLRDVQDLVGDVKSHTGQELDRVEKLFE